MKNAIHARYRAGTGIGPIERILLSQRRKLFDAFRNFRLGNDTDSTLSVGVRTEPPCNRHDYLVAWSGAQERTRIHTHVIDARAADIRLPFSDDAFDWVCCNEAIEFAGGGERQFVLVRELYRVARKGVFVSTPNRRHPLHQFLRAVGRGGAALNLLDAPSLYRFAALLPGAPDHDVGHKRIFGMKAHFFLMIQKAKMDDTAA
jgi:SAM-dependent methyltransferase